MYELQLTNFSNEAIDLRRIEAFDAVAPDGKPLAAFEGEQIDPLLQKPGPRQLNAGATVVVFMQIALDSSARMPKTFAGQADA